MRGRRPLLLVLVSLAVVAGCTNGPAEGSRKRKPRDPQGALDAWDGTYSFMLADQRRTLRLHDDGDYLESIDPRCFGEPEEGWAVVENGWVILVPGLEASEERWFLPVRWGSRRYLVQREELPEFCNRISSAHEPRTKDEGLFFLADGDWDDEVTGLPELPAGWKKLISEKGLVGVVQDIGPDGTFGVSLGKSHGMNEGRVMFAQLRGGQWEEVEVVSVREKDCRVKLRVAEGNETFRVGAPVVSQRVE